MNREAGGLRITVVALLSLSLASCYAHYSWIAVEAAQTDAAFTDASALKFSKEEAAMAVRVVAEIAQSLGLEISRMNRLPPPEPTPENPFQRLALFQGSGGNSNLLLAIAISEDRSVIRCWISDLDHSQETEFVTELVKSLQAGLARAFPTRNVTMGDGRKLRIYAG
jgi:hypothetical protein